MKFDVVLQGPIPECFPEVVKQYRHQYWVGKIILSTWENEFKGREIVTQMVDKVVLNKDVFPGVGNRNRQIVSSREGLKLVQTEFAIKARTDQIMLDLTGMKLHHDNYGGYREALFALGLYTAFPFHPRDHFFMGRADSLRWLYDCELDTYDGPVDYSKHLRSEAWIGAQYFGRFSPEAARMFQRPLDYLVDGAPQHEYAMQVDHRWKHLLFRPFPRVNMAWPKYGLASYHYHVGQMHSEYWHEEEGE